MTFEHCEEKSPLSSYGIDQHHLLCFLRARLLFDGMLKQLGPTENTGPTFVRSPIRFISERAGW